MAKFTSRQRWILATTIFASGLAFFSGVSTNIAIPTIQANFSATLSEMQWIVSGYTLALASLLLICGSIADHFGQKKIFMTGLAIFTLSAASSALTTSSIQLAATQLFQGVGAALMIPPTLALINICFPQNIRGRALGLWSGLSAAVAALGPFAAGWLIDTINWQSIFVATAFFGLIAGYLAWHHLPSKTPQRTRRIDWLGTILVITALSSFSFSLIQGPQLGWSHSLVLGSIFASLILIVIFVKIESKVADPIIPLKLFKDPNVAGANLVTLLLYFGLLGTVFYLTLNLQQIQGYSPTIAGLAILPFVTMIILFSGRAGSWSDKIGPRSQMIIGPLIVSLGFSILVIPGAYANYFTTILPSLLLQGFGMAIVIPPLTKSALSVPAKFSGAASGINNSATRVSTLLAVAILGVIMVTIFTNQLNQKLWKSNLRFQDQQIILDQAPKLGGIIVPDSFSSPDKIIAKNIINSSFISGFRVIMTICALAALLGAGIALLTIKNPKATI